MSAIVTPQKQRIYHLKMHRTCQTSCYEFDFTVHNTLLSSIEFKYDSSGRNRILICLEPEHVLSKFRKIESFKLNCPHLSIKK